MTSMYDVLKASKGIHVDDTFAELWGRKLSNAYTVTTYTGTLPATLQTVEGYLESYKIYGDTEQASGTTTYPITSVTVQALESGTNYAMFNLADFPDVVVGDKITVNVDGTNYTLAVKKVDSTYVYVENREV